MKTLARWLAPGALALAGALALVAADRPAEAMKIRPLADRILVARVMEAEPDSLGRVKVMFPWMPDGSASPFPFHTEAAWILVPATASDATFHLPEVGDEVVIAFEHGDFRRPVILGRMWDGVRPPGAPAPR